MKKYKIPTQSYEASKPHKMQQSNGFSKQEAAEIKQSVLEMRDKLNELLKTDPNTVQKAAQLIEKMVRGTKSNKE